MKQRYNLCETVRELLVSQGYSTVLVVNAVNSAMGQCEEVKRSAKLGAGSLKKTTYGVSETTTVRFEGERNGALDMDAFNSAVEKIEKRLGVLKLAEFPASLKDWLEAHPAFKGEQKSVEQNK